MTRRRRYSEDEIRAALEASAGNVAATARALGANERSLRRRLKGMELADLRRGSAPGYEINRPVPDGLKLVGLSDMRLNSDGKPVWYKFSEDKQRQAELMQQAIEALASEIPREAKVRAPKHTIAALANCYVITDYHVGQLSWPEETGAAWDSDIAEAMLVDWFAAAIRSAPDAKVGILAQLGDLLHHDGERVTPTSRHILDMDTRFQKMVRVVIRALRRVIRMLLGKHEHVHIIMADANHDPASAAWLREMMHALYDDEPRITVDRSPDTYYCYRHGKTSLFFHHGHRRGVGDLDSVLAARFRDVFGNTRWSYAHTGHRHHKHVKESNLMEVEQHQTLAAKDAYSSSHGYESKRSAQVITYHKEWGEVGRVRITPEMLSA